MNASFVLGSPRQQILNICPVVPHRLDATTPFACRFFVVEEANDDVLRRGKTVLQCAKVPTNHRLSRLHAHAEPRRRLVVADRHYPRIFKEIAHD